MLVVSDILTTEQILLVKSLLEFKKCLVYIETMDSKKTYRPKTLAKIFEVYGIQKDLKIIIMLKEDGVIYQVDKTGLHQKGVIK
jgi:hypothetical protein